MKDKKEFIRLYDELRPESADKLDEISEFAFRAFDTDHNGDYFIKIYLFVQEFFIHIFFISTLKGSLTFQEFMVN